MRALTIHQPFAWLIMAGHKTVENRGQRTSYRGPIAIHAGARSGAERLGWLDTIGQWRRKGYRIPEVDELEFSAIVGVAEIVDCVAYEEGQGSFLDDAYNLANNDFASGPFCLILQNARPLDEPIPCSGKQGLWSIDDGLLPESFRAK